MAEILYFAWVKERMGRGAETLALPPDVTTVVELARFLRGRDEAGARAFAQPEVVRAAVNQEFAEPDTPVTDADEIAFFPPVTGG